mgnify:CR=1 FL=1
MLEVFDVFQRFGREYFTNPDNKLLPSHWSAYEDIMACRTNELGGHEVLCDSCNHVEVSYHSCNNRSCPKCNSDSATQWLEKRKTELLSVPYFHVVLTVPHQLNKLIYLNQKALYAVLLRSAAGAVLNLLEDSKFAGGKGGAIAVLHTWNRTLQYHPHVHLLVPGAAIDGNILRHSRKSFLVPTRKLAWDFRELFLAEARSALPNITFSRKLERLRWRVHIADAQNNPENVLQYLGRYIRRMAITNSRLVSITNSEVTFRYKSSGERKWQLMTLSAKEFISRFLMHVLPKGFHKVRYYGFLSPRGKQRLQQFQDQLVLPKAVKERNNGDDEATEKMDETAKPSYIRPCRKCMNGKMFLGMFIQKKAVRAPPWLV